tara:strand:- start:28066 stop:29673 length:1608 start_codon:yes stop_codon:yes gene_type:complete
MITISLQKDLEFITAIDFGTSTPRLSGVIETNSMPNLVSLSANDNHIQDFIFSNQNNTNISEVRLNDNKLPGNVNTYIPQNATIISLDRNLFTTITSLESYTNLEDFHCSDNNITSDIPALNSNIVIFEMGKNNLTGTIPSLESFNNLEEINLEENQLTGTLPSLLANTKLKKFNVSGNSNLTGSIPDLLLKTALSSFEAKDNNLTGWLGTLWPSALSNQIIKIQNNYLNTATIDSLLAALVTSSATTGTAEIGGTNGLPTRGNYNPDKLTLVSRGWTIDHAGGIDTDFSTSDGYSQGFLREHPDWEGNADTVAHPDQWLMDAANGIITCNNIIPQRMRNIRNVHPIKAKVGSKIRIAAEFDFGNNSLSDDPVRTFMLSLGDMATDSGTAVLTHPNESYMIVFKQVGGSNVARLYRRLGTAVDSMIIGDIPLTNIADDIIQLQIDFNIGASATTSTQVISYKNLTDNIEMPNNPVTVNGILDAPVTRPAPNPPYEGFYTRLVDPNSNIKINIQAGELLDSGIGTINVHKAFASTF